MTDWTALYATRMHGVVASDIRERMKLLGSRDIIHLGGGLPDPAIFPYDALERASDAIWADRGRARTALQYAPSEGHGPLREWIAARLTSRGVPCTVENIVITNGSQQAIDFIAKMLLSPGDKCGVEVPSFIGALRAFDAYEPRYVGLGQDADAWDAADFADVRFCYCGPDFRNPTGTTMTRADRDKLLDIADATGMAIVEDSCYQDLRYEGDDIPSILSLAVARTGSIESVPVLHTATFSKTVAPSLRVGYVAGPAEVIRKLVLIKQAADLATSALNQMLLLAVAQDGLGDAIAVARSVYHARLTSMLEALDEAMPEGVTWTHPQGGLYIWCELPAGVNAGDFAQRALAEHAVSIIAGAAFYPAGSPDTSGRMTTFRLSFSMIDAAPAREGVLRLGRLAREMMADAN